MFAFGRHFILWKLLIAAFIPSFKIPFYFLTMGDRRTRLRGSGHRKRPKEKKKTDKGWIAIFQYRDVTSRGHVTRSGTNHLIVVGRVMISLQLFVMPYSLRGRPIKAFCLKIKHETLCCAASMRHRAPLTPGAFFADCGDRYVVWRRWAPVASPSTTDL